MSRMIRVVYAPIHGINILVNDNTSFTTGKLEEDSQIEIIANYCGKAHDQRIIDFSVKLTLFDMEAFEDDISFRNRNIYETYQNARVGFDLLCGAGMLREPFGAFRYTFKPDMLAKRGMRWLHQLQGNTTNLQWVTFLDDGWNDAVDSILPISIDDESGFGNLHKI